MLRLFVLVILVAATPSPAVTRDPNIKATDSVGGGVGPIGGGRTREYERPASQAPDWAKSKTEKK